MAYSVSTSGGQNPDVQDEVADAHRLTPSGHGVVPPSHDILPSTHDVVSSSHSIVLPTRVRGQHASSVSKDQNQDNMWLKFERWVGSIDPLADWFDHQDPNSSPAGNFTASSGIRNTDVHLAAPIQVSHSQAVSVLDASSPSLLPTASITGTAAAGSNPNPSWKGQDNEFPSDLWRWHLSPQSVEQVFPGPNAASANQPLTPEPLFTARSELRPRAPRDGTVSVPQSSAVANTNSGWSRFSSTPKTASKFGDGGGSRNRHINSAATGGWDGSFGTSEVNQPLPLPNHSPAWDMEQNGFTSSRWLPQVATPPNNDDFAQLATGSFLPTDHQVVDPGNLWNDPVPHKQRSVFGRTSWLSQIPSAPEEVHFESRSPVEPVSPPPARRRGRPRMRNTVGSSRRMSSGQVRESTEHSENAGIANRAPRSRHAVRSSSPHVHISSYQLLHLAAKKIGTGMNSGRNLLAVFDMDPEPRTKWRLIIERGRKGKDANAHYPPSSEVLPLQISLGEVCNQYPNHVWGTMLRVFLCEGWDAERIWKALPENCRHKTSKVRCWNYLQQAIGREVDRMMEEETGQKRVPEKRRKEESDDEGQNSRRVQSPKRHQRAVSRTQRSGSPGQRREVDISLDLDGILPVISDDQAGGSAPSIYPTPPLQCQHSITTTALPEPRPAHEQKMANQAIDPIRQLSASHLLQFCESEKDKQKQIISILFRRSRSQFCSLLPEDQETIVQSEWDNHFFKWQTQLKIEYGLEWFANGARADPLPLYIRIINQKHARPHHDAVKANLWDLGTELQALRNYARELQEWTRKWASMLPQSQSPVEHTAFGGRLQDTGPQRVNKSSRVSGWLLQQAFNLPPGFDGKRDETSQRNTA